MKRHIRQLAKNPLLSGSFIMLVGNNLANFLNYLYYLAVGRMLGPADYGSLAALISFIGLIVMIPVTLGMVVTRYISQAQSPPEIRSIISWFEKKTLMMSLVIFLVVFVLIGPLASFLKITDIYLVIIASLTFLFYIPAAFFRAVLHGLLKFNDAIKSSLLENIFRLVGSVVLVYLGFKVGGAMAGILISAMVACFYTRILVSRYIQGVPKTNVKVNLENIYKYSLPVFVNSIVITSIYSTDVILAKHFLSQSDAGLYAALSTLGKIIFFISMPIVSVMFPLVSKKKSQGEKFLNTFLLSLGIVLMFSILILTGYALFPKLAIESLFGKDYLAGSLYLPYFGIFMTVFTVSNVIINYFLSLGITKVVIFSTMAALVQAIGIWFYHQSLQSIVNVSIFSVSLLLGMLLTYLALSLSFSKKISQ